MSEADMRARCPSMGPTSEKRNRQQLIFFMQPHFPALNGQWSDQPVWKLPVQNQKFEDGARGEDSLSDVF